MEGSEAESVANMQNHAEEFETLSKVRWVPLSIASEYPEGILLIIKLFLLSHSF